MYPIENSWLCVYATLLLLLPFGADACGALSLAAATAAAGFE
jgi:hypothetical protein